MSVNSSIEHIGNQLFKYRGFVPVLFAIVAFSIQLIDATERLSYGVIKEIAFF
jgi:hypothetical protein